MKIQIRSNTFETNSSSVHAIAVPKTFNKNHIHHKINFRLGEFGWEVDSADPADYLYTFLATTDNDEYMDKLKEVLDKYNIEYTFQDKTVKSARYYGYYIDHVSVLQPFFDKLFKEGNEETLLSFIFDGIVNTGNDNCSEDEMLSLRCYERTYKDYDSYPPTDVPNPHYADWTQNYNWYEKGN